MDILKDIAWHSFLVFLLVGSMLAIVVGIGLLFAPERIQVINERLARWVDTEKFERQFDRPRWTERHFYRHHRIAGSALFTVSVIVLYKFLLTPTKQKIAAIVPNDPIGLLDAMVALFVIAGALGAVIGLVVFTRPSMLRELENAANRWISTEHISRFFNTPYFSFDSCVLRYRKIAGVFFFIVGLYILLILGNLLLRGQWKL